LSEKNDILPWCGQSQEKRHADIIAMQEILAEKQLTQPNGDTPMKDKECCGDSNQKDNYTDDSKNKDITREKAEEALVKLRETERLLVEKTDKEIADIFERSDDPIEDFTDFSPVSDKEILHQRAEGIAFSDNVSDADIATEKKWKSNVVAWGATVILFLFSVFIWLSIQ
jgi:hypothetical protein